MHRSAEFPAATALDRDIAAMERLAKERVAMGRRGMLSLLGAAGGTALLAGCGRAPGDGPFPGSVSGGSTATATSANGERCVGFAAEANGPYPADGTNSSRGTSSNVLVETGVQRSDIRSSFLAGSTAVAAGVPLDIIITLADVNKSCAPLPGYAVYLWHCDAAGEYSLYDLPGESYLRGLQVSDAAGEVRFTTIWPGRYPHIHFEVYSSLDRATSGRYAVLTSQFAMSDDANEAVYAASDYAPSPGNYAGQSIASDNVFPDNTAVQQEAMTMIATGSPSAGYRAVATVGIAT